ncbi:ead/Ea22-like family protein [Klebsiella variicola subsp. variicola]|uniref:ead/Ea22-like family protein n=1 Tax=Klebsiella variicola TaxID=244366 RepID=UPI00292B765E|nr:ead/Ea22-like family protein [Klebsiella variicola]MDV0622246.1 ead/Ea22-like family protein [Klebsiella variicola subsp. variicola]
MTDITELAQSLKAAAENAIGAHERLAAYPYGEIIDISQHEGEQIDIDITNLNEFNKEANPENILSLVEALEKAQQRIAELENYAEAEAVGADRAAEDCVYWMKRCKELESRTVKLPEPFKLAKSSSGLTYYYADGVDAALTAAGIKVEAE